MVEKVAAGVTIAMERAGVTDPADVHYLKTKTPLLRLDIITDAKGGGHEVWTRTLSVVNVFCTCQTDLTGRVRDRRNIMLGA